MVGGLGPRAWQIHVSDCRNHVLAAGVLESSNQTDLPLPAPQFVPREPEAVGWPKRRFALVLGHDIRREHEFLFRRRIIGIRVFVVKRVHGQTTVDQDRSLLRVRGEHQTAAKSPYGRFARLVQHRVRPHGGNAVRRLWFGIGCIERQAVVQIPFRTSAQCGHDEQSDGATRADAKAGVGASCLLFVRFPVHAI